MPTICLEVLPPLRHGGNSTGSNRRNSKERVGAGKRKKPISSGKPKGYTDDGVFSWEKFHFDVASEGIQCSPKFQACIARHLTDESIQRIAGQHWGEIASDAHTQSSDIDACVRYALHKCVNGGSGPCFNWMMGTGMHPTERMLKCGVPNGHFGFMALVEAVEESLVRQRIEFPKNSLALQEKQWVPGKPRVKQWAIR